MLRLKRLTVLSIIIVIQTALAVFVAGIILARNSAGRILPGVTSAGVSLGGVSPEQAEETLKERFGSLENDVLVLEGESRQWTIPMKDIGAVYDYRETVRMAYAVGRRGWVVQRISDQLRNRGEGTEVPLYIKFDQEALENELDKISQEYRKDPQNARLALKDGKVSLISCLDGREVDVAETLRRIKELRAGVKPRAAIASRPVYPRIRDQDLSGLTDVLGQCSTRFESYSAGRVNNIARAVSQIGDTLIGPGEIFSLSRHISPIDERGGYQKAPVIIDNQLVDDYGGGICQVATTLYGAVLLSGLEIVERHPHSRPVKYVPPGLDATVAEGLMDFRFKNIYSRPVYIIASAEPANGYVKVAIVGHKEQNTVYKVETEVKTISPGIVMRSNSRLKPGQTKSITEGFPGFDVSVFRVSVSEGGKERRELISNDYYPPESKIIEVGF
ncbi:MAG: VanW family protein [Peptococcaceae bacterium]|nr:VanW family protein [Peptococcaceae bacterium]